MIIAPVQPHWLVVSGDGLAFAFFDSGELVAELWLDGNREDPDDWYAREVVRMSERAPA